MEVLPEWWPDDGRVEINLGLRERKVEERCRRVLFESSVL